MRISYVCLCVCVCVWITKQNKLKVTIKHIYVAKCVCEHTLAFKNQKFVKIQKSHVCGKSVALFCICVLFLYLCVHACACACACVCGCYPALCVVGSIYYWAVTGNCVLVCSERGGVLTEYYFLFFIWSIFFFFFAMLSHFKSSDLCITFALLTLYVHICKFVLNYFIHTPRAK